ncbi:hypothetical protein HYC85_002914 [Camellia sinensis]|uniref:Protein NUCLEAR FUSION DEFECTIVE 6, chloroplastic/mitochondrial-like n=1 Tax=Camellia sinensis TaxID=4442 RepID=A0A7J7IA11_CAMSI|nr:hypothetical protein HYC85_002914 [Camellia sinensis]
MATNSARRLFQRSTSSANAFLSRKSRTQSPPVPSNLGGLAPSSISARVSRHHHSFFSTRLPVELGCGESLMPLHSATASSLLNSMLSSKVGQWGCLSEGTKLDLQLHYSRALKFNILADVGKITSESETCMLKLAGLSGNVFYVAL